MNLLTRNEIDMNYYIQGDAANAERIKAAFEKLGYKTGNFDFRVGFFFTCGDEVHYAISDEIANLIKTHPDYKELELHVEPKFKVVDWLVYEYGNTFAGGSKSVQVKSVKDDRYIFTQNTNGSFRFIDKNCRLWTIADAKDGDVITNGKLIVIFNKLEEPAYRQHIIAYVGLDLCGKLQITEDTWQLGVDKAMPATKEQRDLLFAKMKEAGYEWDADKKELKKIQHHYDIANFHAGMPVLVRDANDKEWRYVLYSHNTARYGSMRFNAGATIWNQCIPFEGNEHLLGTTDMCPEEYINW